MSALSYCQSKVEEEEEKESDTVSEEEQSILDSIFDRCYDDLIQACKEGKVNDENSIIGSILSLMERVIPKLLDAYKDDKVEYETRCLSLSTALRVTIGTFISFDKFMEIMSRPEMKTIDNIVENIAENGKTEEKVDELADVFKNMKATLENSNRRKPDIYG